MALPDGRVQVVQYTAGDSGYQAKVTYEESPAVGSGDGNQLSEPPVPIVLVRSPQVNTSDVRSPQVNTSDGDDGDSLFTHGGRGEYFAGIRNKIGVLSRKIRCSVLFNFQRFQHFPSIFC